MDKKTYNALAEIIGFAENAIGFNDTHPDALWRQFKMVKEWMKDLSVED